MQQRPGNDVKRIQLTQTTIVKQIPLSASQLDTLTPYIT